MKTGLTYLNFVYHCNNNADFRFADNLGVYLRVIHVLRSWEWFQRPVQEAVQEDQSSTSSPHHQNGGERYPRVINHLKTMKKKLMESNCIHVKQREREAKTISMQVSPFAHRLISC